MTGRRATIRPSLSAKRGLQGVPLGGHGEGRREHRVRYFFSAGALAAPGTAPLSPGAFMRPSCIIISMLFS